MIIIRTMSDILYLTYSFTKLFCRLESTTQMEFGFLVICLDLLVIPWRGYFFCLPIVCYLYNTAQQMSLAVLPVDENTQIYGPLLLWVHSWRQFFAALVGLCCLSVLIIDLSVMGFLCSIIPGRLVSGQQWCFDSFHTATTFPLQTLHPTTITASYRTAYTWRYHLFHYFSSNAYSI